jgi:hypothetical protein
LRTKESSWSVQGKGSGALRVRAYLAALVGVVALLAAVTGIVRPEAAGAAPVGAAIYVANDESDNVLSFPATASGDVAPTATISPASPDYPWGSAFDSAGDLWVVNYYSGTVVEYTASQLATSGSPSPAVTISAENESLYGPSALAFDRAGDLWVANDYNDTLVEYTPGQLTTSGSPTPAVTISATGNSLADPVAVAFDRSGDLWVSNYDDTLSAGREDTLVEYTPGDLSATGSPTPAVTISATGNSLDEAYGLAFDSVGDLWVSNLGNNTLVEYTLGAC